MSLLNYFKKRYDTQVEKRSYSKIYLVLSLLLFLSTTWAVIDEVSTRRPWKNYQTEYYDLFKEKLLTSYEEHLAQIDTAYINSLQNEINESKKELESDEYKNLSNELADEQQNYIDATREWRFAKSESDATFYEYKYKLNSTGVADEDLKNKLVELDTTIAQSARLMIEVDKKVADVKFQIGKFKNKIDSLEKEIILLTDATEKILIRANKTSTAPIEIRQVMMNDFEKTSFGDVKARIDRCQTCHLGAMEKLMSDVPQPYAKHSLPELLEKHNPEKFGCTPCHRGQGNALTAGFAHGDEDHYWETPILKGKDVYASCNSCHYQQVYLKNGVEFSKAKQTFLEVGCVGCHYLNGYNDVKPIGPHLNSLPAKVSVDWAFRWIKNPRDYNTQTRMPNFKFNNDQSEAITAYLFKIGKESEFKSNFANGTYKGGNATEGMKIFETVGCQSCHVVGKNTKVREARGTSYDIAPELTKAGSKLNGDWIYDWIKNPQHFSPETKMPSLRLSDAEAKHIVAFILSNKDETTKEKININISSSEKIKRGEKLIREYGCYGCHKIKGFEKDGKISVNLSDFGRKRYEQMDFGDIAELPHNSKEDFVKDENGKIKVKHDWNGWVTGKLHNSRLFQTERIIQKMPIFNFGEQEIKNLKLMLMSYRVDNPLPKYQQAEPERLSDINKGQKLVVHYACINCHNLEDQGNYFAASLEDPSMGPPMITMEGAKVQEPWLNNFLKSPTPIRPWLKVRMPSFQFSEEELNTITKYFLAVSKKKLEVRDYASFKPNEKTLPTGKYIFDAFQCIKCHQLGGDVADAASLAPDLKLAQKRLKPEWIVDWLKDPQAIQPGTMMPGYFPDGESPLPDLENGNVKLQMEAIRDHLFNLNKK